MTVLEAAERGTYRDLLVALRDLVASTIDDGCSARDLVGLSRRLLDLSGEIRAIDAGSRSLRLVSDDEPFDPAVV